MFSLSKKFIGYAAGLLSSVGVAAAQEQDLGIGLEESCPAPVVFSHVECSADGTPPIAVFANCEEIGFTAGVLDLETGASIIIEGTMADYFETVATLPELKQQLRSWSGQTIDPLTMAAARQAQQALEMAGPMCAAS